MARAVNQQQVHFGDAPLVLVGEPRQCVGVLSIHNPQQEAVKLRRIRLRTESPALQAACDSDGLELTLFARFGGCETKLVEIRVALPSCTAPGCYTATLEGAEQTEREVRFHVLERRELQFVPSLLGHTAERGQCFKAIVTAVNLGNVPVAIPAHAALELVDTERNWHDHFHSAAASHGDHGTTPFLDQFIKRMGRGEAPVGRVHVSRGAGPLPPGQSRVLELGVSLPVRLRAPRRYRGVARLGPAALSFDLYITRSTAPNPTIG